MKTALLILLLSFSTLAGNTYLIPSTKQIERDADLIIIGTVEAIKKTKERELGTEELAEKEITIRVQSILKGKTKEKSITVIHSYDDTATLDGIEVLKEKAELIMEQIEELELSYAQKRKASQEFTESKKGKYIQNRIQFLQKELEPLIGHMRSIGATPFTIPDSWQPSKDEEFLIFLSDDGSEYTISQGSFSFRELSYLNKLPKHAIELK